MKKYWKFCVIFCWMAGNNVQCATLSDPIFTCEKWSDDDHLAPATKAMAKYFWDDQVSSLTVLPEHYNVNLWPVLPDNSTDNRQINSFPLQVVVRVLTKVVKNDTKEIFLYIGEYTSKNTICESSVTITQSSTGQILNTASVHILREKFQRIEDMKIVQIKWDDKVNVGDKLEIALHYKLVYPLYSPFVPGDNTLVAQISGEDILPRFSGHFWKELKTPFKISVARPSSKEYLFFSNSVLVESVQETSLDIGISSSDEGWVWENFLETESLNPAQIFLSVLKGHGKETLDGNLSNFKVSIWATEESVDRVKQRIGEPLVNFMNYLTNKWNLTTFNNIYHVIFIPGSYKPYKPVTVFKTDNLITLTATYPETTNIKEESLMANYDIYIALVQQYLYIEGIDGQLLPSTQQVLPFGIADYAAWEALMKLNTPMLQKIFMEAKGIDEYLKHSWTGSETTLMCSYECNLKGGVLLNFLEGLVTKPVLEQAIIDFYRKLNPNRGQPGDQSFSEAFLESVENSLQTLDVSALLPPAPNLSLTEYIKMWVETKTTPIVTFGVVEGNPHAIQVSQHQTTQQNKMLDFTWIPIYLVGEFEEGNIFFWLPQNGTVVTSPKIDTSKNWIIADFDKVGAPFRALYDDQLLKLISQQLEKDHEAISVTNRIQLMSNYQQFFKHGRVSVQNLFEIIPNIAKESNEGVWERSLMFINLFWRFMIKDLTPPIHIQIQYEDFLDAGLRRYEEEDPQYNEYSGTFEPFLRVRPVTKLLEVCSHHAYPVCIQYFQKLEQKLESGQISLESIPKERYCLLIRHSNNSMAIWTRVLERADKELSQNNMTSDELWPIIHSLSCTTNTTLISQTLLAPRYESALDYPISTVISILASLPEQTEGTLAAAKIVGDGRNKQNWNDGWNKFTLLFCMSRLLHQLNIPSPLSKFVDVTPSTCQRILREFAPHPEINSKFWHFSSWSVVPTHYKVQLWPNLPDNMTGYESPLSVLLDVRVETEVTVVNNETNFIYMFIKENAAVSQMEISGIIVISLNSNDSISGNIAKSTEIYSEDEKYIIKIQIDRQAAIGDRLEIGIPYKVNYTLFSHYMAGNGTLVAHFPGRNFLPRFTEIAEETGSKSPFKIRVANPSSMDYGVLTNTLSESLETAKPVFGNYSLIDEEWAWKNFEETEPLDPTHIFVSVLKGFVKVTLDENEGTSVSDGNNKENFKVSIWVKEDFVEKVTTEIGERILSYMSFLRNKWNITVNNSNNHSYHIRLFPDFIYTNQKTLSETYNPTILNAAYGVQVKGRILSYFKTYKALADQYLFFKGISDPVDTAQTYFAQVLPFGIPQYVAWDAMSTEGSKDLNIVRFEDGGLDVYNKISGIGCGAYYRDLKGAVLLKFLRGLVSKPVLEQGIVDFYRKLGPDKKPEGNQPLSQIFLSSVEESIQTQNVTAILPPTTASLSLAEYLKPWIDSRTTPTVTFGVVEGDSHSIQVSHQSSLKDTMLEFTWIPINLVGDFEESLFFWLPPNGTIVTSSKINTSKNWIIADFDRFGAPIRALYDDQLRKLISQQLVKEHEIITVTNRIHLVSNYQYFLEKNLASVESTIETLDYLGKENDEGVWTRAVNFLYWLNNLPFRSEKYNNSITIEVEQKYKSFLDDGLRHYENKDIWYAGFGESYDHTFSYEPFTGFLIKCKDLVFPACTEYFTKLEEKLVKNDISLESVNEVRYCVMVKYSSVAIWKLVLEKAEAVAVQNDVKSDKLWPLVHALSCTSNSTLFTQAFGELNQVALDEPLEMFKSAIEQFPEHSVKSHLVEKFLSVDWQRKSWKRLDKITRLYCVSSVLRDMNIPSPLQKFGMATPTCNVCDGFRKTLVNNSQE